ncbi:hypothetical protein SteCoe_996 [Stentor coeruleus]|uniref:Uncharacterized protein n=1 Tax=Stentor coeruleus TaxID=5963 RepID=A0A1R2D2V7_9CILI|nr:hypothetical protein SteCoe_996 [Stentor coeruleus]
MISSSKISLHSRICLRPTEILTKLNNATDLQNIDFRIDKLKNSLEVIQFTITKPISPGQRQIYAYLIKQANEIVRIKSINQENLESCLSVNKSLENYQKILNENWHALVYYERLKMFAKIKSEIFLDTINKEKKHKKSLSSLSDLVQNSEKNPQIFTEEVKTPKHFYHSRDKSRKFLDVNSDTNALEIQRVSISRSSNSEFSKSEISEFDILPKFSIGKNTSEDDERRVFYSKCLKAKLNFPSRDPTQFIQISDLYRLARNRDIPLEKFDEFITDQFRRPEIWVNLKNVPRNK